mgnify:CR=1 FL=1
MTKDNSMKKSIITIAAAMAATFPALAGGLVTNTNQSVAFFRMPAQEAVISVDGAYFNPAGIGFMNDGLHLGLNWEAAWQTRQTTTKYAPLMYGKGNDSASKLYKGKAFAPCIPSLDIAFVRDRWFIADHFGVLGGGGKASYGNGLGAFESQIAQLAAMFNQAGVPVSYGVDMNLEGTQYFFANQILAGYRINDHISIAAGLRLTYGKAGYNAAISNIQLNGMPAAAFLNAAGFPQYAPMVADRALDCVQSGLGAAPVVSVDCKAGNWNFAARYEFKTRLALKNTTKANTSGMSQFDDGKSLDSDIPAVLAAGIGYTAFTKLHLYGSVHYYFDKGAKTYNSVTDCGDRQNLLGGNTQEYIAGIEYDICDWLTVSCGAQRTAHNTGKGHEYNTDLSFAVSSTSLGAGAKVRVSPVMELNLGYFHTLFDRDTKIESETLSTEYFKTSKALGIGMNFAF